MHQFKKYSFNKHSFNKLQTDNVINVNTAEHDGLLQTDWRPLLPMLLDTSISVSDRASCFHISLAQHILQQAVRMRSQHDIHYIGLCGGVFQNRVLTETTIKLLEAQNFNVTLPKRIPMNDAGISFGQVIEYLYMIKNASPDNNNSH